MNLAVRINLAAELGQRQEAAARREFIGKVIGAIVMLALVAWTTVWLQVRNLRCDHAAIKFTETPLNRDLAAARANAAQRLAKKIRRDSIIHLSEKHRNWAPVLERIFAAMPANVEIRSLHIRTSNSDKGTVLIMGRSAGAQPLAECDKCRLQLADALTEAGYAVTARFAKLESVEGTIHFEATDYPTAEFTIELKFKDHADDGKT